MGGGHGPGAHLALTRSNCTALDLNKANIEATLAKDSGLKPAADMPLTWCRIAGAYVVLAVKPQHAEKVVSRDRWPRWTGFGTLPDLHLRRDDR